MRVFLICLLIILFNINLHSQTVSGYVEDAQTQERLVNAHIYIPGYGIGTATNNYGFFSLTSGHLDSIMPVVSYIGYKPTYVKYEVGKVQYNISLQPDNELSEVVIDGKEISAIHKNEMSVLSIPIDKIKTLPSLGGEFDIMKIFQTMPGIQGGKEGESSLYVRGGGAEQNLFLIDDIPLYNVNHLGGFVSVFNDDILNSAKLIKGGFSAKYGNRLSSVVDVRMKDGNLNKTTGSYTLGMIASKISLEIPVKKDKSSIVLSGRRFLYDLITRPVLRLLTSGSSMGYSFYDYNIKFNYKLTNRDRLYLSFYAGDDKILADYKEPKGSDYVKNKILWGNVATGARWNHLFNNRFFCNTTLYYTQYHYNEDKNIQTSDIENTEKFRSKIRDFGVKSDFEYYYNSFIKSNFGVQATNHFFKPGTYSLDKNEQGNSNPKDFNESATYYVTYMDGEFKIRNRLKILSGIRGSVYNINNKDFFSFEPRLLFNLKINKSHSIKASYTEISQNMHLLSNSKSTIKQDLWMPATERAIPEKSKQLSIGLFAQLFDNNINMSIEAYNKKMDNLIAYKEGAKVFTGITDWHDKIETNGTGSSSGIEFFAEKKKGKVSGWLAYTWSKSTRQFDNINNGKTYPYEFDRRHYFSSMMIYRISEKRTLSANWVFGSGNPITLPASKINVINDPDIWLGEEYYNGFTYDNEAFIYPAKNSQRMKSYHRLDVAMNFYKEKKRGTGIFTISIYNLYMRQNPYFYYYHNMPIYGKDSIINHKPVMKQISFFPFVPAISYTFRFN